MTNMKILYVITKSNWGGAQRYVYDLATSLSQQGHDVSVALGGNGLLAEKLKTTGVRVFNIDSMKRDINLWGEFKTSLSLLKIIWQLRPDVVHVNSSKAGGLGALAARLLWVKNVIFTAHAWAFNENRHGLQQAVITALHWTTVMLNHRTIAVSNSVKKQISWLPFMRGKIRVIHPASPKINFLAKRSARTEITNILEAKDAQILNQTPNVVTHKFETNSHTKWIGTIAELHPVKNLFNAIDSVDILRKTNPEIDFRYIIIGEGELKEQISKYIIDRGLQSHVYLTGFIDNASQLLKAFDVFMLTSFSEAFGYVLIEAGMAEVPVVASQVGGIPEVVSIGNERAEDGLDHSCGILIAPRDKKAFALALKMCLANDGEIDTKGRVANFKKHIADNFSIGEMVKKVVEVYEG
jgi:glycosyltransferase involved in cell wall biosynthesis